MLKSALAEILAENSFWVGALNKLFSNGNHCHILAIKKPLIRTVFVYICMIYIYGWGVLDN